MVDPKKIGGDFRISLSDGMGSFAPLDSVEKVAAERGCTGLRFNGRAMGWAYHKPDQALGEDGRLYVKADRQ
jgi:hypothetical protein